MIRTKFNEILSRFRVPENLSPHQAEVFRRAAQIVLSSRFENSTTKLDLHRPHLAKGKSIAGVLGYERELIPHLSILKNALEAAENPTELQPEWLDGYSIFPFPSNDAFKEQHSLVVSGVRQSGELRELYYGSHPDSTKIDPATGEITPDMIAQTKAVGVLSSPLDVARRTKLRLWFSPYEVSGLEWQQRLAEDPFAQVHLVYQGVVQSDGFRRSRFYLDTKSLQYDVVGENSGSCYDELAIAQRAQQTFSIVELAKISDGTRSWRVYASGNTHGLVKSESKEVAPGARGITSLASVATR